MCTPRTILVVDDEEDIRETLRDLFEDEGFHVVTAADGCEALDVLEIHERPSLILLDLVMPGMDGWQLFHMLQQNSVTASIPVVVSTSVPSRAPLGVRVVPKPVDVDDLVAVVKAHCG